MALSGVAGALLVLAFPPFGFWPLAVLAVAGLALAVHHASWRPAAGAGASFGMVFFMGLMPWLRVIGIDAWILLSLFCTCYLVAMSMALAVVSRVRVWPILMAATWVLAEAVRDRVPLGGFPWGRLAFANDDSPFTGWVAVGGAPWLTFIVALTGCLLAYVVLNARSRPLISGAVATAALMLVLSGILVPRPVNGSHVTAAVVQGNVPRTGLDAFGQREAVLDGHVEATHELADSVAAGRTPQPDLVVWPENSSDIDPFHDPAAYELIDGAIKAIGVDTLVGLVVEAPDGHKLENTGVVWSPTTGPGESYVKRHPVPFGEYVPFRGLLSPLVSRLSRVPQDFVAGTKPGVLRVGSVNVGDVICFEVAYDGLVRDVVRGGGQVLAVQTNNATYGRTGQVEQQLAISRLRAVETGRSTLIAATSGISAIIAPDGTIQQEAPEFTRQSLVDEVVLRDEQTMATRLGAIPEYLVSMVALVGLGLGYRKRSVRAGE